MSLHATSLFPDLLKILSDNSDDVVFQGLSVLAEIVNSTHSKDDKISQTQYRKFLVSLLTLFSEEKPFLENRGAFIIRFVGSSIKPDVENNLLMFTCILTGNYVRF